MSHFDTPPTLREIAERLSVVDRWNGWTTISWSVLQHSILVGALTPSDAVRSARLVALLHDVAEAYMGDIPRSYKVPEQYEFEAGLIREIYDGLGYEWLDQGAKIDISRLDDLAALAEANVLCHPKKRASVWLDTPALNPREAQLVGKGQEIVWSMRDMSRHDAIDVWTKAVQGVSGYASG